jgi:aspartyl-tRNA(Asn)/glutamyl-tRNA(Gln) amidotransferase subunit A
VRDAALVTQVMGGPDGRDPFCAQIDPPDMLGRLDAGAEGLRFAWTDDFGCGSIYASDDSPRVIEHVRGAARGFTSLGATVSPTSEAWEDWPAARAVYTAAYGSPVPGAPTASAAEVREAFELRGRNWDRFRDLFREHDLLLSPTAQRVARTVEEWEAAWTTEGRSYPGGTFANTYTALTAIFNWLRFPAVSVPCGFVDGLPVGLQIVGWPGRDDLVLRAAAAFQAAFPRDERPAVS